MICRGMYTSLLPDQLALLVVLAHAILVLARTNANLLTICFGSARHQGRQGPAYVKPCSTTGQ